MSDDQEISRLRQQVEQLNEENMALRDGGFRGSKAEALMTLEYGRIPNLMKTPRSIGIQRKVATAVMIIVPLLLLAIGIGGGINAYRDHQYAAVGENGKSRLLERAGSRSSPIRPGLTACM